MDHATPSSACPDIAGLEKLAAGVTTDDALHRHVQTCPVCSGLLAEIEQREHFLKQFKAGVIDRPLPSHAPTGSAHGEQTTASFGTSAPAPAAVQIPER